MSRRRGATGALPEEAQLYYGFSRFEMELNEVRAVERDKLHLYYC